MSLLCFHHLCVAAALSFFSPFHLSHPYSELDFNRSLPFFRLRTMCYTHPLSPASPLLSSLAPDSSFPPSLSLFLLHSPLLSLAFCLFSPNFHASPPFPCILIMFHFRCRPLGSFNIFQLHLQCVCLFVDCMSASNVCMPEKVWTCCPLRKCIKSKMKYEHFCMISALILGWNLKNGFQIVKL